MIKLLQEHSATGMEQPANQKLVLMLVLHMLGMINAPHICLLAQLMEHLDVKIDHAQMPQQQIIQMIYVKLTTQKEIVSQRLEVVVRLILHVKRLILKELVIKMEVEKHVSGMEAVKQKHAQTLLLPTILILYASNF